MAQYEHVDLGLRRQHKATDVSSNGVLSQAPTIRALMFSDDCEEVRANATPNALMTWIGLESVVELAQGNEVSGSMRAAL